MAVACTARMLLRHPQERDTVAEFGFDPVRGYWVETTHEGNRVVYDAFEGFDADLVGALIFLGSYGFFDDGPVAEALRWAVGKGSEDVPRHLRRIVRLIRRWREAAGE